MSIYDGLCDVGSMVGNRCPNPAEFYSGEMAWCQKDKSGSPKGDKSWEEIAAQLKAQKQAVNETIDQAEKDGMFLRYGDGDVVSPKTMREILANGWSITSVTATDPQEWINAYEQEAKYYRELAAESQAKATTIKRALPRK